CWVRRRSPPATSSSCAVGTQQPHSKTGRRRHDARAEEPRVVTRKPPLVLRHAELEEAAGRDVHAGGAPAPAGEIVAVNFLGAPQALPYLHRQGGDSLGKKARSPSNREVRARIGEPVDEEEIVARFLLHDGLEHLNERGREEAGALGEREQAE